jgi:hypothetical protein
MRNPRLFAIPLVVIFAGLSALHAYWALGGRWGSANTVPIVGGRRSFEPSPLATWVVCALLGIAVAVVAGKVAGIGPAVLRLFFDTGVWGLSLVFLVRAIGNLRTFGFFKTITGTPFAQWDTWLYSPLCLLISLLAARLAWLPRQRL